MLLADMSEYTELSWLWIPIVALVLGWTVAGTWLLHRGVRKHGAAKRPKVGKSLGATVLAGAVIVFALGVSVKLIGYIGAVAGMDWKVAMPLGGLVGGILGLILAFMVIFTMFGLSFKTTMKLFLPPALTLIVMSAVIGVATVVPAQRQVKDNRAMTLCRGNSSWILSALQSCYGQYPTTLESMVGKQIDKPEHLRCPGSSRAVGYFYQPRRFNKGDANALLACDFKGNHNGKRSVITGSCPEQPANAELEWSWKDDSEFQALLALPVNEQFAKALAQAEAEGK